MKANKDKGTSVGFSKQRKERINYVKIANGNYVAAAVNLPICIEAESFEELKKNMFAMGEYYLEDLTKTLAQEEPFEFVQVETFQKTKP